jgi:uncharacterized protein (TIGR00645 family)
MQGAGMNPHNITVSGFARSTEIKIESFIFSTRWVLAPAYLVLFGCLAILTYKTFEEFIQLIIGMRVFAEGQTISQVLTIVDLILVMNLVLMVLFVGYVTFVSRIKIP